MPIQTPALWLPSYSQGFARSQGEAANPGLWDGLAFNWHGPLGVTGSAPRDTSGHHADSTLVGGAVWDMADGRNGIRGVVSGDDYVNIMNGPVFAAGTQPITLAATVKFDVGSRVSQFVLATGDGFEVWLRRNAGNDLEFGLNSFGNPDSIDGSNLADGVWHSIVGSYDGTTLRVYLNGQFDAGVPAGAGTWAGAAGHWEIGAADEGNGGGTLEGIVVDASIWNRALSPNEIQKLYQDPHAITRPTQRIFFPSAVAEEEVATTTTAISIPAMWLPSYSQGFAHGQAEAANPGLWDGLVWHGSPGLGPTGLTLFDQSGFGNNGVLTNMEPATDWVMSPDGYALDFNGGNDRVVAPTSPVFFTTTQFTISAWVFTRDSGFSPILEVSPGAGGERFGLWVNEPNLYCVTDSQNSIKGGIVLDTWQHCVVTFDLAGNKGFWIDGVSVGTTGPHADPTPPANSVLNLAWGAGGSSANVIMREPALWGRVLSPNEIQTLYRDPHAITRPTQRIFFPSAAAEEEVATTTTTTAISIPAMWLPSYSQGFAHGQSEAANPGLWDGLKLLYQPTLGITGNNVFNLGSWTNNGSPTALSQWGTSRHGSVLDFDRASAQPVTCGFIDMASWSAWTVWTYIRYDGAAGAEHGIAENWNTGRASFLLRIEPSNDQVECFVVVGVNEVKVDEMGTPALVPGTWHSVVVTFNTMQMECWVDGIRTSVQVATGDVMDATPNVDDPLILGDSGSSDHLGGSIAGFAIYDRQLPPNEIQKFSDPHAITRPMQRLFVGGGGEVVEPPAGGGVNKILGGGMLC